MKKIERDADPKNLEKDRLDWPLTKVEKQFCYQLEHRLLFEKRTRRSIENIILDTVVKEDLNYLLIIKAGNISSQNKLIKYFESSSSCILTPCYEENVTKIKNDIISI